MVHFKREYNHYKNATHYPDGICIISYFGKVCKKKREKVDTRYEYGRFGVGPIWR